MYIEIISWSLLQMGLLESTAIQDDNNQTVVQSQKQSAQENESDFSWPDVLEHTAHFA